jgi:hypothetical protein
MLPISTKCPPRLIVVSSTETGLRCPREVRSCGVCKHRSCAQSKACGSLKNTILCYRHYISSRFQTPKLGESRAYSAWLMLRKQDTKIHSSYLPLARFEVPRCKPRVSQCSRAGCIGEGTAIPYCGHMVFFPVDAIAWIAGCRALYLQDGHEARRRAATRCCRQAYQTHRESLDRSVRRPPS